MNAIFRSELFLIVIAAALFAAAVLQNTGTVNIVDGIGKYL